MDREAYLHCKDKEIMKEEMHKIGGIYQRKGKSYKLVDGDENDCAECVLREKTECIIMPDCWAHHGHYELVEKEEKK